MLYEVITTVVMEGSGYQFLTGSTFSRNKNIRFAIGYLGNQVVHLLHRLALADEVAERIALPQFLLQLS